MPGTAPKSGKAVKLELGLSESYVAVTIRPPATAAHPRTRLILCASRGSEKASVRAAPNQTWGNRPNLLECSRQVMGHDGAFRGANGEIEKSQQRGCLVGAVDVGESGAVTVVSVQTVLV